MAEFRTACLEDLVDRLRLDLADHADLADRLELAFRHRDAELVAQVMDDMARLSQCQRAAVHDAILDWLFGGDPAAGLRVLEPASPLAQ
jgi:hypothetical protein